MSAGGGTPVEWWDCARRGHRVRGGTIADLVLELDALDPLRSRVVACWETLGTSWCHWCTECSWWELIPLSRRVKSRR